MALPSEPAGAAESSLRALAHFVIGDSTIGATLQQICELATEAVGSASYTGITMLVDGQVTTSVFSDPDVLEIDQAQYAADNGPCISSFRTGEINLLPSTERDDRWPEFSQLALAYGVHSTMSLPLHAADDTLGALNFYSDVEDGFSEADVATGSAFAAQAAVVLANAQAYVDAQALNEQLAEAMRSRATIEQAKGILIAQSSVDPDTAFEMLRSASQRENRKLREIAADLVARHVGGPEHA